MDVIRHIADAVERYWADDVEILGAWPDGEAAACVVYRRTIDPMMTLGQRFEFHAGAADGTIEGFARDVAVDLVEPIGTAAARSPDRNGIVWVAISEERPTPEPPPDVGLIRR